MGNGSLVSSAIETISADFAGGKDAWIKENSKRPWGLQPSSLETRSSPKSFSAGTGMSIFRETLLPALESAQAEVILVTCFWAASDTLDALSQSLLRLSKKACLNESKIRVYICFSSHGLLSMLFHSSSPGGQIYPSSQWKPSLGLPSPEDLPGLEMSVKSKFLLPFSVMHPKFMIVDRQSLFMPSCNVSWEKWYECCIELRGDIVTAGVTFWGHFWEADKVPKNSSIGHTTNTLSENTRPITKSYPPVSKVGLREGNMFITLLPSPHHNSLKLSLPMLFYRPLFPFTPLNVVLIHLITTAQSAIHILTPNLTSGPVIKALLRALDRGVKVTLITNKGMMVWEQLLTARTTTERCLRSLRKDYLKMRSRRASAWQRTAARTTDDIERGLNPTLLGELTVKIFSAAGSGEAPASTRAGPVKSHVKCSMFDESTIVLGSGNQDRASWYTSQELGIVIQDRPTAQSIWSELMLGLDGKLESYHLSPVGNA